MARALIVGCGCRGRSLGRALVERGWVVRGTTRDPGRLGAIEGAGIEAVVADPDRIGTVVDQIEGVSLIFWLFATPDGGEQALGALHGPRLERLLEEIVDTPVRGFVLELAEGLDAGQAGRAFEILQRAGEVHRIPCEVVAIDVTDHEPWLEGMLGAATELIG